MCTWSNVEKIFATGKVLHVCFVNSCVLQRLADSEAGSLKFPHSLASTPDHEPSCCRICRCHAVDPVAGNETMHCNPNMKFGEPLEIIPWRSCRNEVCDCALAPDPVS